MKAIAYADYGAPETLELIDLPDPEPEADDVLIQVSYAAVNPVDWKVGEGRMKAAFDCAFPLVVGRDIAGVVVAVGDGVDGFSPGDEVFAALTRPGGGFAEKVAVPATHVANAPRRISLQQSAALPLVALTCWQALVESADLKKGQTVFVLSGAGGTGSMAVQIARSRGAKVLTTCGPHNHNYVKQLGADLIYDYTGDDPIAAVRQDCPDGVDVVLSNVLGGLHAPAYGVLKRGGMLVTIGEAPVPGLAERYGIREVDLVVQPNGAQLGEIARLVDDGEIQPPAVTELSLSQCARAFRRSMDGHVRGKIVLTVR